MTSEAATARVRLVPGATLVDSGPDETHVLLPNHNVTFVNDEITRLVHAYADALASPTSRDVATRTVLESTGAAEELCDYVWDLLERSGCLAPGTDDALGHPLLEFWASQGRDPAETQARLATTPVALVAPDHVRPVVTTALEDSGLTVASVCGGRGDLGTEIQGAADEGAGLLVCFALPYGSPQARDVNAAGLALGLPMLFGHVSGLVARIGPFVLPGATACMECTVLRTLAHAGVAEARVLQAVRRSTSAAPAAAPVHPVFLRTAASLFALEAATVALSLPATTLGAVVELVQGESTTQRRTVRRVPTCPECHPGRARRFGWDATFRSPVLTGEGE